MNKRKSAVAIALIVIIALVVFFMRRCQPQPPPVEKGPVQQKRPCPGETKEYVNDDPLMAGLLGINQKFKVIENFYDCNPVQRGDLVYFPIASSPVPVVRRIVAIPGDTFVLSRDPVNKTWNLTVNGEMVKSTADPKRNYYFGSQNPATLSLYAGKPLDPSQIILFAGVPPGANDSGIFGIFNINDSIGKVVPE